MSKGKNEHRKSGQHQHDQRRDPSQISIGRALGMPDHSKECIAAGRDMVVAKRKSNELRTKVLTECPEFAEFEKLRNKFYTLAKVVRRHPAFCEFEKSRMAFLKSIEARNKIRSKCLRCEATDPAKMFKAIGGEVEAPSAADAGDSVSQDAPDGSQGAPVGAQTIPVVQSIPIVQAIPVVQVVPPAQPVPAAQDAKQPAAAPPVIA